MAGNASRMSAETVKTLMLASAMLDDFGLEFAGILSPKETESQWRILAVDKEENPYWFSGDSLISALKKAVKFAVEKELVEKLGI